MELRMRSRLERIASGSMWTKPGMIFPIVASAALLGFRKNLVDYLPFLIIFFLFVIQGVSISVHSRIDAIYELMKIGQRGNHAPDKQLSDGAAAPADLNGIGKETGP